MGEDSDFELVFWKVEVKEAPHSSPDTHVHTHLTFFFLVLAAALLVWTTRTRAGIGGDWIMCFVKSEPHPETRDRKVQSEFSKCWSMMEEHGTRCARGEMKSQS